MKEDKQSFNDLMKFVRCSVLTFMDLLMCIRTKGRSVVSWGSELWEVN